MVLTWGADRHGVIDDLAGLQEQLDLPLWRIIQVELVQLDADLLHGGGFGHGGADSQSCGGAAEHSGLTHDNAALASPALFNTPHKQLPQTGAYSVNMKMDSE